MTALICSSDVKSCYMKEYIPKLSGAIALVVTSRSSSFEYTMSVHAVHIPHCFKTPCHGSYVEPRFGLYQQNGFVTRIKHSSCTINKTWSEIIVFILKFCIFVRTYKDQKPTYKWPIAWNFIWY